MSSDTNDALRGSAGQDPTDAQLWDARLGPDAAAFTQLYDRHGAAIYNFCFRRTASWSAAEDLTSVVFLAAWRRRSDVVLHRDSALPWLYGIANNVCRNASRSLRRHRAAIGKLSYPSAAQDHADSVSSRVDDERRMTEVMTAIGRLPRREQEVLALVVWAGLEYAEAAVALDVPVGTVRSRLSRARDRLKGALTPPEHPDQLESP